MKRAFELGIEVPKTLEGWADFFPRYTVLPWLKGRKHRELQNMREYLRIAFHRVPVGKVSGIIAKQHEEIRVAPESESRLGSRA